MTDNSAGNDIPIHKTNLPEARVLEDLFGIFMDFHLVNEALQKLLEPETLDRITMASLFSGALMAYRRCFNTGVRHALRAADAESMPDNNGDFHRLLIAQANKLIAHSVNPFEATSVGLVVKDGKVIGMGRITARLISFDDAQFRQWGRLLTQIFETVLKPRIAEAEAALLKAANGLRIEDITRMPLLGVTGAKPNQADSRR